MLANTRTIDPLELNSIKEKLSVAYIHGLNAYMNYGLQMMDKDLDGLGVDCMLVDKVIGPGRKVASESHTIFLQLKAVSLSSESMIREDEENIHYDVSGIASDLVNFVSNEKAERQIIIVTHNASLVICADTENVVVSSISSTTGSGYNFSYSTGSIENPDRRDDIVRILEGGEDALRKRMQKLNIN